MTIKEIFEIYDVDAKGNVYNKTTKEKKETFISNSGYERVSLWKNGKGQNISVHRLVAFKYLSNPNNYKQVNHIDGNKLNNNVDNLEWCSREENMKHAYKNNLINSKTTKVKQYDKNMNLIKIWNSIKDVERELGISHSNITTVCKNNTNRKYAGGYIWRYE